MFSETVFSSLCLKISFHKVDMSDTERDLSQPHSMATPNSETQRALNYSTLAATAAAAAVSTGSGGGLPSPGDNPEQQSTSSTETLLRNIQSLLKVAADNARQQERQISYEKGKCFILKVFFHMIHVFHN